MESDEDDQGVALDPYGYPIDARQRGFAGDELYFTGYDLGQHRRGSYRNGYYDEQDSEEDAYARGGAVYDGREEALAQAAYDRIARARATGKTNVNLSVEEMEVLERRRGVQQPAPLPPPQQIASPPATPVKTPKGKSRNNSSASLSSQKGRKKITSGVGSSTPPSSKSNSKAKVGRKGSVEQALPYPTNAQHPGPLVSGPNGMMYAPVGYYPPPSPELARVQPGATRPRSRSTSKHSRRESTPPEQLYAYPPRYYPPPAGMRPPSSGSNRSAQEELDWYPPPPPPGNGRMRSASNAHQYRLPDDYAAGPSMPAAQGRRSVGGSPDVSYSTLRRAPPSSSPLAPRQAMHYSDPAVVGRKGSGLSQEVESSSGSSDDQGVQVEVLPEEKGGGYAVSRSKAKGSANEGRRRKGRK